MSFTHTRPPQFMLLTQSLEESPASQLPVCSVNRPLHVTRHIAIAVARLLCTINFDIWDPSKLIGTQDGGSATLDILSLSMFNNCTKPPVKWDKGKETQCDFTTGWSGAWSWPWSGALTGCRDIIFGTGKNRVKPSATGTYTWARGIDATKLPLFSAFLMCRSFNFLHPITFEEIHRTNGTWFTFQNMWWAHNQHSSTKLIYQNQPPS